MKLFMYMGIANILAITTTSASESVKDHVDLISAVYKSSKSFAISLMHFINDQDSIEKNRILNIQVQLSRDGILTSSINLEKLGQRDVIKTEAFLRLRQEGRLRTTNVFLLISPRDFRNMRIPPLFLETKDRTNLVLFTKSVGSPSLKLCIDSNKNIFPYEMEGISLLVKCHGAPTIREWYYSVKNGDLRTHERATWGPGGLMLKSESLVMTDENALNGEVLLTYAWKRTDTSSEEMMEYLDEIFDTLRKYGNFTTNEVSSLRKVALADIDIFESLHIVEDRGSDDLLTYSESLMQNTLFFAVKQPERKMMILWSAYFQPFTMELWIAVVLSFIVIQAVRVFMVAKLQGNLQDEESCVKDSLYISGIYCQHSIPEFPRTLSLRMFYSSICLFTLSVWTMYSAEFVTELTTFVVKPPFISIVELAVVKSHKLMAVPNTYEHTLFTARSTFPWKEVGELMVEKSEQPKNTYEGFQKICQGYFIFARVGYKELDFMYDARRFSDFCTVMIIKASDDIVHSSAMLLRKDVPYSRAINRILRKLKTTGLLKRMKSQFNQRMMGITFQDGPEEEYPSATFWDMLVLLTILLVGMIFSIIILIFEIVHHWMLDRWTDRTQKLARPLGGVQEARKEALGMLEAIIFRSIHM